MPPKAPGMGQAREWGQGDSARSPDRRAASRSAASIAPERGSPGSMRTIRPPGLQAAERSDARESARSPRLRSRRPAEVQKNSVKALAEVTISARTRPSVSGKTARRVSTFQAPSPRMGPPVLRRSASRMEAPASMDFRTLSVQMILRPRSRRSGRAIQSAMGRVRGPEPISRRTAPSGGSKGRLASTGTRRTMFQAIK